METNGGLTLVADPSPLPGPGGGRAQTRPARTAELAAVYGALARHSPDDPSSAPALALVGTPLDTAALGRLHGLGVDVHAVDDPAAVGEVGPAAVLLGGSAHGTVLPAGPDGTLDGAAVVAAVERARLRDWAGDAAPGPRLTTLHRPGSDSRGVVQFRLAGAELVAKIGDADAIAAEARFATEVNATLARDGRRALFPVVHGLRREGGQAVSLMEAGEPVPIAPLFADPARTVLADDAGEQLQPHLDQLAAWYGLTAEPRRPTVADYLYRERYHVLPGHPAFRGTFRALFGELSPAALLAAPVRLPGADLPGWTAAVGWLDEAAPALLPESGSAVHGDIYAANMLRRADGSPLLIDPRTVWDGRDRPDVGFGDPVYDLATLLHGVLPMAAVLRAVETGTTGTLFAAPPRVVPGAPLDLTGLRLPTEPPAAVTALEERMLRVLPPTPEPRSRLRARMYVGAATSLAGWLKYERSLRTREAWLATYGYVIWYLARARTLVAAGPEKEQHP